jgi:hypothetical protein
MPVHLAAKHTLELKPAHAGLERTGFELDIARSGFIVFALGQLEQLRGITDGGIGLVQLLQIRSETRTFAAKLLSAIRGAPDRRLLELAIYFLETLLLAIVLKETPSRRRHAPRDLSKCA